MRGGIVFALMLMLALLVFPGVSADVITPTVTNVYFEQGGQAYNGDIEFTVRGYGYSYSVGPRVEREPGTYTPEVVFSFTGTYSGYGDRIYETYYRNYRRIDYYELEGKTADGKTFVIKDIENIPTNCSNSQQYDISDGEGYYKQTEEYNQCMREESHSHNLCKQYLQEMDEADFIKDDNGYPVDRVCELRFDLDTARWDGQVVPEPTPGPTPGPKGFWGRISCFFKRMFGGSC
ncbi:MAG: hypothetical protein ABIH11_05975 [Candidatus Altiarchaeota archaeon]